MKFKTPATIIIIVILLFSGGYWLLYKENVQKVSYRTELIGRGDIEVTISATGTLNAVTTVQVGSQVSGTIAKLYADFNSVVKEGQLLAQLDPTFLQATVNEQQANVDRARAQGDDAQRNYNRMLELFKKSLVSQSELDAATTALESAEAGIHQAQASLERAKVNLKYATICAPINGTVISRNVDVGQTVAASLQAPTLFTIANDLKKMQVEAGVDEADIGSVKVGQNVSFRVDAYPNQEFDGIVSQIRLAPVINQNVVTYTVIINVDNPDMKLMPGMTATVSIEVAHKENVLRIPLQALHFTPSNFDAVSQEINGQPTNDRSRIWILQNDKPVPVFFHQGIQNIRFVEIIESKLMEGEAVIVGITDKQTQTTPPQGQNPFMPTGHGPRRGGF